MKKYGVILLVMVFIFIGVKTVSAGSAQLTWNKNTESDLDGYKIYYDTSSHAGTCPTGYASSLDVTDETMENPSKWLDTLTPGQTYYFQVTAYDTSANESDCSAAEVTKLITYRGDINASPDHGVNLSDVSILAGVFGQTIVHKADINRNGTVDLSDVSILAGEFGSSF